jgi:hypothetical protein
MEMERKKMIVNVNEYDGSFMIGLIVQNAEDSTMLVRFGMNAKKRDMFFIVRAPLNKNVDCNMIFSKYEEGQATVVRNK